MNIEELKEVFKAHVEKFNMNEKPITKKFYHSYRVMDICEKLAYSINLNEEDTYIAMVIGLLHDYARFEQWTNYKTFSDLNSIDHADLAVKKLFDENEIDKFKIKKEYYEVIYNAIKYHNKLDYPENLDDRNKLFCKIIRDADKIDILYLLGLEEEKVKEDELEISEKVKKDFYCNNLRNRADLKNINDNVVLKIALLYDLNFKYSYKYIKDNKLMYKMFETLKYKDKFKPYFEHIYKYIEERSK